MARRGAVSVEAAELPVGKAGEAAFNEDNQLEVTGASETTSEELRDIILQGDSYGLDEKLKKLAFAEEMVTIMIHESSDPNAEKLVYLAVNGEGAGPNKLPWVQRGVPIKIRRKFVERLARAKNENVGSVERVNPLGEREVVYPKSQALKYPFSVIEDRNPNGAAWLQEVLAERA